MEHRFTQRQRDVLALIAAGKTNREIGEALGISLDGAKWHVAEILAKLDAESREEAAEYWRHRNGLAPRFARIFRGVSFLAAWKWGTAAAAAGCAAVLLVAISGALSNESGSSAPTPSSLPPSADIVAMVVQAVERGDVTTLAGLEDYIDLPCAAPGGPGEVPCPQGFPPGATLAVMPYLSGCSTNFLWQGSDGPAQDFWSELLPPQQKWSTYAVARTHGSWAGFDGIEHVLIFELPGSPERDLQLGVTTEGVRVIARGCGGTPATDAASFSDFLLPPR